MRIRTVKPEFWRSDDVASLNIEDRLLFIGLWSYVDDSGIGVDKIAHICADLFAPDLEANPTEVFGRVTGGLQKLSERGMILRYKVEGKPYLYVTNWKDHQRIDKPSKTRFPMPDKADSGANDQFREYSGSVPEKVAPGTGEQGSRGTGEQLTTTLTGYAVEPVANSEPDRFAEFWDTYPRKMAKQKAVTKYRAARKRATQQEIIDGAHRLATDPNLPEKTYIPHPTTWLERDGWHDEPLPPRFGASLNRSAERVRAGIQEMSAPMAPWPTDDPFAPKGISQ